jgi:phage replication-related protein YjqB (UPF0714/DUF867 family)
MEDIYKNFNELTSQEIEGLDFHIETEDRGSDVVIIGIHGGEIEPGTETIARALAGSDLSYYLFIGTGDHQHITSNHFDEKRCERLVCKSKTVISIHGKKGDEKFIMLGGLDEALILKVGNALEKAGFVILDAENYVKGESKSNICNRCLSGQGLQMELSRGLRDVLSEDARALDGFVQAVRGVI